MKQALAPHDRLWKLLGTTLSLLYWPAYMVLSAMLPIRLDSWTDRIGLSHSVGIPGLRRRLLSQRQSSRGGPGSCGIRTACTEWLNMTPDGALFCCYLIYLFRPLFTCCTSEVVGRWTASHGPSLHRVCKPRSPRGSFAGFLQEPWELHRIFGPRILVRRAATAKIMETFDYSTGLPDVYGFYPSGTNCCITDWAWLR